MTDPLQYADLVEKAINVPELFFRFSHTEPRRRVYSQAYYNQRNIAWREADYLEVSERVAKIARGLSDIGVKRGDRVAVICGTRPEWLECDLAILSVGAVSVAVYPSLPAAEIAYILFDSGASVAIAENEEQLQKLKRIRAEPQLIPAREGLAEQQVSVNIDRIITIEQTTADPIATTLSTFFSNSIQAPPIPDAVHLVGRNDIASLVYTSGTTGPSKGVIQTHGNHLANISQAVRTRMFAMDGDLFLFLPLAHSFARLIGYLGFLTPASLKFTSVADTKTSRVDLVRVATELGKASAQVLPTVPRLFEKIKAGIEQKAASGGVGALLLRYTLHLAQSRFRRRFNNETTSAYEELLYRLTTPIRQSIKRKIFGPTFSHAISGGAKLPVEVNCFFWSLNVEIYEGYGLTETCVATNVNLKERNKIGSVGPSLEGILTHITEEGEICFKGPNVSQGYWNRPQATADSWNAEGWFHTGDIGYLDDDGFLFITDRKKDLVITAGGKKIPPLKVETLLMGSPFISQAIFCGDGKPFCVALVTLNQEVVIEHLLRRGISVGSPLSAQAPVLELLSEVKDEVNKNLSSFEEIKRIAIIDEELTIDNGLLTPTLKIKRKVALNRYKDLFESLYL